MAAKLMVVLVRKNQPRLPNLLYVVHLWQFGKPAREGFHQTRQHLDVVAQNHNVDSRLLRARYADGIVDRAVFRYVPAQRLPLCGNASNGIDGVNCVDAALSADHRDSVGSRHSEWPRS